VVQLLTTIYQKDTEIFAIYPGFYADPHNICIFIKN